MYFIYFGNEGIDYFMKWLYILLAFETIAELVCGTVNSILSKNKTPFFIETSISLQCLFYINVSCSILKHFSNDFKVSSSFSFFLLRA